MNNTEIKKALYKQKPIAEFQYIRNGVANYRTLVRLGSEKISYSQPIFFEIPVSDMGNADFKREMDAKLLNRWIVEVEMA